jgi:redox-sensitive bicupin YhaK (pirin superfamily)
MKTIFHPANERGHANHGWLDSHHSFSFSSFYDPLKIHFGALRVLNDDRVKGGAGFGQHPHDNMEIVSIPTVGALAHQDTTGTSKVIATNDVQIMSAGIGLEHSEFNASKTEPVNFFQLWIFPKEQNITPRYEQKTFNPQDRINGFQTVVSPTGGSTLTINQDAWISLADFSEDIAKEYVLNKKGNGVYVFVIEGELEVAGKKLNKRDAIGIWETEKLSIVAKQDSKILMVEVPMEVK